MIPNWVYGGETGDGSTRKYLRAVETLRKQGITSESEIKALYIKYGGRVVGDEVDETAPEAPKRGRKAKE